MMHAPPIRDVQRSLHSARDEQIARVVAMVDGLADRSAADALIDPLRPRLAVLKPSRPVRFARLLFMPLDPVIVPAPQWRPGRPAVPRSALPALADAIQTALATYLGKTASLAGPWRSENLPALREAGGLLWPAASRALAGVVTPPPSWNDVGLPPALFVPIARAVASVLEQAVALDRLAEEVRFGLKPAENSVDAMLNRAATHGDESWALMIATLLGRLSDAGPVVARLAADLANQTDRAIRNRAEQIADALLDRLDAPHPSAGLIANTDLVRAGTEVRRAALLLDALDRPGTSSARRKRVLELRRQLDASSRTRFESGLRQAVAAPLEAGLATGGEMPVEELEAAARALRDLEGAGRRLGDAGFYDRALTQAAQRIAALPEGSAFDHADKVRLVELLAGPDHALALLAA